MNVLGRKRDGDGTETVTEQKSFSLFSKTEQFSIINLEEQKSLIRFKLRVGTEIFNTKLFYG